jgi:hypothetical protein
MIRKILILILLHFNCYASDLNHIVGKVIKIKSDNDLYSSTYVIRNGNQYNIAKVGFKIKMKDYVITSQNTSIVIELKDKTILNIGKNS